MAAPRVFDATGRVLGRLIDTDKALVTFADGEAWYRLDEFGIKAGDGSGGDSGAALLFTTSNCTGTPYINAAGLTRSGFFDAWPKTAAPGYSLSGTLYYAKAPFARIVVKSVRSTISPPGVCEPNIDLNPVYVGRVGKGPYVSGVKLPLSVR